MYNTNVLCKEDDSVTVQIRDYDIVIKHNDIGVSIDVYDEYSGCDNEPIKSIQYYFDDLEDK